MSKHILRVLAAMLMSILLMMSTTAPVLAFDARSDKTIQIDSGEVVDDDLYVVGKTITIDGTINGDFYAIGRIVDINGLVKNSVIVAGETVNINGEINHTIRAAGRTLNISGNVDRDAIVAGEKVTITNTAKIVGDLLFGAKNAHIDGSIESDIKGGGSEVIISNEVKGNVELKVDRLTLLPTANIQGNLTYTSAKKADIQSGAQIAGRTIHNLLEVKKRRVKVLPFTLFSGIRGKIIGFLMALIAGLIIILLAPRWLASMAESIRTRPGPSFGWGALILFATPIAVIIACITIVGIPLGLIILALYGIAIYLSQIPVGLLIGRLIIGRFRGVEDKTIMFGALALGLIILRLLRLIPYIGFFIKLAIILFGLGAVVASEKRRRAEA